jgi:hypothetical protein
MMKKKPIRIFNKLPSVRYRDAYSSRFTVYFKNKKININPPTIKKIFLTGELSILFSIFKGNNIIEKKY